MGASYPFRFPLPDRNPYAIGIGSGVLRTPFANGFSRQRRLFRNLPHQFSLQFTLRATEIEEWQQWVNENGWTWFQIDLQSGLGGGEILAPHEVRFISDIEFQSQGWNLVTASVNAEASPDMLSGRFIPVLPPPVQIVNLPNLVARAGDSFSFLPILEGGRPPFTFSALAIPFGWTFNSSTGLITSPPLAAGLYGVNSFRVEDALGTFDVLDNFAVRASEIEPWIIGGSPNAPSPIYVFGGTTSFPIPDFINPGLINNPSVVV